MGQRNKLLLGTFRSSPRQEQPYSCFLAPSRSDIHGDSLSYQTWRVSLPRALRSGRGDEAKVGKVPRTRSPPPPRTPQSGVLKMEAGGRK